MARNKAQNQLDMLQTAKEIYIATRAKLSAFEGDKISNEYMGLMENMFNARDFMIDAYVDAAKMSKQTTRATNAQFDRVRRQATINPVYRDKLVAVILA